VAGDDGPQPGDRPGPPGAHTLAEKIHLLPVPEATVEEFDDTVIKDERLDLIFTCCPRRCRWTGR
jgi:predicted RNA polymerase sigma factor